MKYLHSALFIIGLGGTSARVAPASLTTQPVSHSDGKQDMWLGFTRHTFKVDGCPCWLVEPKTPLPGIHWVWWLMFPTAFPERTGAPALLAKGYYYAYMSVGDTFGAPSALDHLDAFYGAMTQAGLRSKVALVGLSRGGLYAYNWAARNPEKVSTIYGDAPVCNFASWPYAHGAPGGAEEWKKLLSVYGFKTNEEALACPSQPIKEWSRWPKRESLSSASSETRTPPCPMRKTRLWLKRNTKISAAISRSSISQLQPSSARPDRPDSRRRFHRATRSVGTCVKSRPA